MKIKYIYIVLLFIFMSSNSYGQSCPTITGIDVMDVCKDGNIIENPTCNKTYCYWFIGSGNFGSTSDNIYLTTFYDTDGVTVLHTDATLGASYSFSNSGTYNVTVSVTTASGCEVEYREAIVVEDCKEPCRDLLGIIKINNAANYCNGVKLDFLFDSSFFSTPQINSYSWTFFDLDGTTVLHTLNNTTNPITTFNYPNSANGDYLVQVDVNYGNNCTKQFQRTFSISDCSVPCDKADIPENLLINLLQYLVTRLQAGDSAADINGTSPQALTDLAPYLIDADANGIINNFTEHQPNQTPFFSFSFSPNHKDDVIFYSYGGSINDLDISGLDLDFENYYGPSDYTIFNAVVASIGGGHVKKISVRHINFCSDPIDNPNGNDNEFCTSEFDYYPTIGDLTPSGANIEWYLTETGGEALNNDDELVGEAEDSTGAIYWWDNITDGITNRTAITTYVDLGALETSSEIEYQEFSILENATVIDLLPSGSTIQWYISPNGGNPLSSSTLLQNGSAYYAQEIGNNSCRLEVDVFVGVKPPVGDGLQQMCPGQTLADLVIQLESADHTIEWYASETGGNSISESTLLVNDTIYYAAQLDVSGNISEERLAIIVFLNTVNQPVVPFPIQVFDFNSGPHTIADLIAFGTNIQWYPQAVGGNVYAETEGLFDPGAPEGTSHIFWAEQNVGPCPSTRVQIEARLEVVLEPPLLGCEKFKPQPGDRYVINAWVREQPVTPVNPQVGQFNGSEEKDLFKDLLNHLLEVTRHADKAIHDINFNIYKPLDPLDGSEIDFDALIPFVKFIGGEIKLKVYNYERIVDNYGGQDKGRTIGFRFKLSSDTNAPVFEWQSPFVKLNGIEQNYRYPINDNPALDILFTNVEVQGNIIKLTSNFEANGIPSLIMPNYAYYSPSGLEESKTDYDYEEIPDFQPLNYINTKVTLEYRDENQELMPAEGLTFEPKGEIIDGWQRVYAEFVIPSASQMTISLKNKSESNLAYFDDIRMHPYNSSMKTFVYHPVTQRLMSELDENNYATFYEYDAEGGLIRVKKETEKGIYTIQETRSSTIKQTN